jgi:pentatricopeptide repeat protein
MTAASYNALLAVYAVSKVLDERGDQLLQEMYSKGLLWDSYTYTALMMGRGDRQEVMCLS